MSSLQVICTWYLHVLFPAATAAKSLQSCPTLCDPMDGSPPGSPIPGILQARTLEWVAISFSNAWKWNKKVKSLSRVRPSVTPWTAAYQAPPSMGFSRQEYWSGVPLRSPILFPTCCLFPICVLISYIYTYTYTYLVFQASFFAEYFLSTYYVLSSAYSIVMENAKVFTFWLGPLQWFFPFILSLLTLVF